MGGNAVGHIDIIVRKKPGGQRLTIHLADLGNRLLVTGIDGAYPAEYQKLRAAGEAIGQLIEAAIGSAGHTKDGKMSTVTVTKSLSNIKNN